MFIPAKGMMEYETVEVFHGENSTRHEATGLMHSNNDVKDAPRPVPSPPGNKTQVSIVDGKGGEAISPNFSSIDPDTSAEVNMEAPLSPDDVIRAGGFGARDDISSFLPVASDSTDFEATIRDAKNYEELQGEVCRPGLGWTEDAKRK